MADLGLAPAAPQDLEAVLRELRQLTLLFEATRALNSTLELEELLEVILRIAREQIPAERGTVFLVDGQKRELWSLVAEGLEGGGARREIRLPIGQGIAGAVAASGAAIRCERPYEDPRFDPGSDASSGFRTRSLLCLPARRCDGEIVAVLQLLNHARGTFTAEDEEFLRRLSDPVALALENARLHREAKEKERLERELALGREIQRDLLPEAPPAIEDYEIAMASEPFFPVSGDYYDFLPLPDGDWLFAIADVEGKGVAAALVMSNLQAALRALARHVASLPMLVRTLNTAILEATRGAKYLTLFVARFDPKRRMLRYVNAGHPPPLLLRADGAVEPLETGGTVVGLLADQEYESGHVELRAGDWLAYCTDGITEAMNAAGDEFGPAGLARNLVAARGDAVERVNAIMAAVAAFARGGTAEDDKTLVLLRRRPALARPA